MIVNFLFPTKKKSGVFSMAGLACFWAVICIGCASQDTRWDSPILAVPTPPESGTPIHTPSSESVQSTPENVPPQELIQPQVQRPFIEPIPEIPAVENAWMVATTHGLIAENLIRKAEELKVTQIHLGGDILQAVDDLILNPSKRSLVQNLASQLESKNIRVLVSSREIHLEGRTFLFDRDDPLLAARQAAYRKVFQLIPELDGVVLSFSDALLPPWEAVIPDTRPAIPNPERIRFMIDTVYTVVVGEMNKLLYIRLDDLSPQQFEWIAQALTTFTDRKIAAIVPFDSLASGFGNTRITNPLKNLPKLLDLDLAGVRFGGPWFIVNQIPRLPVWETALDDDSVRGTVTAVIESSGSLLNSPNEINLEAFFRWNEELIIPPQVLVSDWIQKRYQLLPMTREGIILSDIYDKSVLWNRKIGMIQDSLYCMDHGTLPDPEQWSFSHIVLADDDLKPEMIHFYRRLIDPDKQLLVDIQQESTEAIDLLDKALWDLESMRLQVNIQDYNDLYKRLEYQRLMAEAFLYGKQVIWGFAYWKKTRDEDEALYLESHLQKLEQLANDLENRYGVNTQPGNPNRIREWVKRIRSEFPRVILGWKERKWNRLQGIVIRQTGSNNAEVLWKSMQPSTSRVFITTELPIFERMVSVGNYPVTDHKANLDRLETGKTYFIKIQCVGEKGEVTNSGIFPFQLESTPVL